LKATIEVAPGVFTYRNQVIALSAIRDMFGDVLRRSDDLWQIDPGHSLMCVGSATSNAITRKVLGDPLSPRFRVTSNLGTIVLPYSMRALPGENTFRIQDQAPLLTWNHEILAQNGSCLAKPTTDKDGVLSDDFLLVTRIPGSNPNTDIVVFGGIHGPAIWAIDLLLRQIHSSELTFLRGCLGTAHYYQAVFHVTGLKEHGGTTVPGEITCVRIGCPPVALRCT
jgi:hypothetical protein